MCGIIGYVGEKKAQDIIINGLSKLEYRGYDSTGIAILNDSGIYLSKRKGKLNSLLKDKLLNKDIPGNIGIGHTRWATHGEPSDRNAHPFISHNGNFSIIHNGIIENYSPIKDKLIKLGYTFTSDTDSEVIAHLIEEKYKNTKDILEVLSQLIKELAGSYAIVVLSKYHTDRIFAISNECPVIVGKGTNENFITSDVTAILKHTKDVYYLDDFDIVQVTKDSISFFDKLKNCSNKELETINWNVESAEKGGFEHFMLKEIYEQPKIVKDTFLHKLKDDHVHLDIILTKEEFAKVKQIYITGCGTAYYAGLIAKHLIESKLRINVIADVASEFRYKNPILDENTIFIAISQSGETIDTISSIKLAKQKGARVISVVNVVGSTIDRLSDEVIYTSAGPEISVASTKAFSAQVAAMYLLVLHIGIITEKISHDEYQEIKKDLLLLPSLISEVLDKTSLIEKLSAKYVNVKNTFYIGRGLDYLIAMEGSLKLKEIAYVHSEPYAAGELKHGPIALLEEASLIIAISTQNNLFDKTINNIRECIARGAKVLILTTKDNEDISKVVDDVIYIPKINTSFISILANIPLQIFAYYVAKKLGNNVDKPRNLAKSVTVE